jgi:hypothetical protein
VAAEEDTSNGDAVSTGEVLGRLTLGFGRFCARVEDVEDDDEVDVLPGALIEDVEDDEEVDVLPGALVFEDVEDDEEVDVLPGALVFEGNSCTICRNAFENPEDVDVGALRGAPVVGVAVDAEVDKLD